MKKHRRLEARKKIDELQNQHLQAEAEQSHRALQKHLAVLEKEFQGYSEAARKKRKLLKAAAS